jgi:hypothetical protein
MLFDLMQAGAERLRRFALYALLHYGLLIDIRRRDVFVD